MTTHRNDGHETWVIDRRVFLKSVAAVAAGPSLLSMPWAAGETSERQSPVRFGVVTDCHYADIDPSRGRFYRKTLDKLAECVEQVKADNVDFLIELGDFKDQTNPPVEAESLAFLDKIEAVMQQFDGPTYHVLGNHDVDSLSKTQFLEHIKNTDIDPKAKYYSFDVRGVHFVVLDANYKADGTEYDHGNFTSSNTRIPATQLEWLKADLAAANGPAIVFVHQPIDKAGQVYVQNSADVRAVLQKSGKVLAVFQGHRHCSDCTQVEGIHYCTLEALVEGEGPEGNAYAVVEVRPNGDVIVTGYRREVSRELSAPAPTATS